MRSYKGPQELLELEKKRLNEIIEEEVFISYLNTYIERSNGVLVEKGNGKNDTVRRKRTIKLRERVRIKRKDEE